MPYYTNTYAGVDGSKGRWSHVNDQFDAIEAAFALLEVDSDRALRATEGLTQLGAPGARALKWLAFSDADTPQPELLSSLASKMSCVWTLVSDAAVGVTTFGTNMTLGTVHFQHPSLAVSGPSLLTRGSTAADVMGLLAVYYSADPSATDLLFELISAGTILSHTIARPYENTPNGPWGAGDGNGRILLPYFVESVAGSLAWKFTTGASTATLNSVYWLAGMASG